MNGGGVAVLALLSMAVVLLNYGQAVLAHILRRTQGSKPAQRPVGTQSLDGHTREHDRLASEHHSYNNAIKL